MIELDYKNWRAKRLIHLIEKTMISYFPKHSYVYSAEANRGFRTMSRITVQIQQVKIRKIRANQANTRSLLDAA